MPGTSWSPRPVLKVLGGLLHQWRLEAHLGRARRTRKVCSCGEGEPSAGLMFEDAQEVSLEAMGPLEGSYACVTALRPLPAARVPPSGFWLLTPETAWRAPHKQRSAYSDDGTKRPPAEKGRAQRLLSEDRASRQHWYHDNQELFATHQGNEPYRSRAASTTSPGSTQVNYRSGDCRPQAVRHTRTPALAGQQPPPFS
jgi:hypothetical protein